VSGKAELLLCLRHCRRSAWLDIGGIDEGMMGKGECAIWSDYDISMRLWLAGYQIGYYPFSR
jgi:GT2 family glycosyltransferase